VPGDDEFPKWWIYRGTSRPGRVALPAPPPWRSFTGRVPDGEASQLPGYDGEALDAIGARRLGRYRQAVAYQADDTEINLVNLALHLRRPLLVTGNPGVGKSTLAYSVAQELELGPVLRWPITSRTTLDEGLYQYDAIGRLQEVSLRREAATDDPGLAAPLEIGAYVRLGPLGTALLPWRRPRVLLIDEIDKSDIDLPNDLLNVFEEGEYDIDELARLPEEAGPVRVMTADPGGHVEISRGHVRCLAFPFVLLTSNGEREFPPAFLRRCLRLNLQPPDQAQVEAIVTAHLGPEAAATAERHVREFLDRRTRSEVTTDQLLNAVYLATSGSRHQGRSPEEIASLEDVASAVMRPLSGTE
jgi:MoxR-like ATPase